MEQNYLKTLWGRHSCKKNEDIYKERFYYKKNSMHNFMEKQEFKQQNFHQEDFLPAKKIQP